MKYLTCFLFAITGLIACEQKNHEADERRLKSILLDYLDGVSTMNVDKLNEMTTDDFVLFEGGRVWNNDSLINSMKKRPNVKIKFKLDSVKVRVDNQSGRIIYFNYGDVFVNDTLKRSLRWIESATFRKVNSEWKMEFLHSSDRRK